MRQKVICSMHSGELGVCCEFAPHMLTTCTSPPTPSDPLRGPPEGELPEGQERPPWGAPSTGPWKGRLGCCRTSTSFSAMTCFLNFCVGNTVDFSPFSYYNNLRSQSRSPLRGAGCIRLRGRLVAPTREPDTDHTVVGKDADYKTIVALHRKTDQQCDTFFRKGVLLCQPKTICASAP